MVFFKYFILPIALFQFSLVFGQTDIQSKTTSSSPLAEEKQSLLEAYSKLIKKNDSFVTANREKIFSPELARFDSIIDSLEHSVRALVKNYERIDSQIIDSLLAESTFAHRRYRLLYPQNYHRFSDFTKKAKVSAACKSESRRAQ